MTEKKYEVAHEFCGAIENETNIKLSYWELVDLLNTQQTTISKLEEENEQLKQLLKEAQEEILTLKESKEQLLESIVEKDSEN